MNYLENAFSYINQNIFLFHRYFRIKNLLKNEDVNKLRK